MTVITVDGKRYDVPRGYVNFVIVSSIQHEFHWYDSNAILIKMPATWVVQISTQ